MAKKTSNTNQKKPSGTKSFEDVFTSGKTGFEAATKTFETLLNGKGMEEATELSKQNLQAVAETTNLLTQGYQEINNALLSFAQQSWQSGFNTCKELLECKNIQDAIELHTNYAREFIEGAVNEGSRISEMSLRVANEAFEPVRDRVNVTVEKMIKNAA